MTGKVHLLPRDISSAELARHIGLDHTGPACRVKGIGSASSATVGVLTFGLPADGEGRGAVWVGPPGGDLDTVLVSVNPRLDFIRALHFLRDAGHWPSTAAAAIHASAKVHGSVVIEAGAQIGPGCVIGPNAVIAGGASLKANVTVGAGTVIGHPGFGYARQADGTPLHFPHLGRIVIGADVVVGNQCSLSCGTLDDTTVGPGVKIDDGVYIAHNVSIGANTLIMSGVRLNGRVAVGVACWLGTGALVREGISIGDRATIGMGAVVVKPVRADTVHAGNPARIME